MPTSKTKKLVHCVPSPVKFNVIFSCGTTISQEGTKFKENTLCHSSSMTVEQLNGKGSGARVLADELPLLVVLN